MRVPIARILSAMKMFWAVLPVRTPKQFKAVRPAMAAAATTLTAVASVAWASDAVSVGGKKVTELQDVACEHDGD